MAIKQRLFRLVGRFMGDLGDLSTDDQRAVRGCDCEWEGEPGVIASKET